MRSHLSKARLAFALLATALLGLPGLAGAQIIQYEGTVGIDSNGNPAVDGPGVTPTHWYDPSDPLVVVNVPCPSSSTTISESKTSTVGWSLTAGAKAGVDWGVVKAELSAQFGVQIGASHTITISKTVPADAYTSKEVSIFTRYQRKRYTVLGRTIDVHIPIGWYQKHKDVEPTCPCKTAQNTSRTLRDYVATLNAGVLRDEVSRTVAHLDDVLASFDRSAPQDIDAAVTSGIEDALLSLVRAAELGADPDVVESAGASLTLGTLDNVFVGQMNDADSGHTFDDDRLLRFNPFLGLADEGIERARALASDANLGIERFGAAARAYSSAIQAATAGRILTYSALTAAPICGEVSDGDEPGEATACEPSGAGDPDDDGEQDDPPSDDPGDDGVSRPYRALSVPFGG